MREEKEDIIAVQETHAVSEENLRRRGTMSRYVFIAAAFTASQQTLRARFLTVVSCIKTHTLSMYLMFLSFCSEGCTAYFYHRIHVLYEIHYHNLPIFFLIGERSFTASYTISLIFWYQAYSFNLYSNFFHNPIPLFSWFYIKNVNKNSSNFVKCRVQILNS
jgi:hypothetical protein